MSVKVYQTSCDRTRTGVFLRLDSETGKLEGIRCPYYDSKKPKEACRITHRIVSESRTLVGYESGRCIIKDTEMIDV